MIFVSCSVTHRHVSVFQMITAGAASTKLTLPGLLQFPGWLKLRSYFHTYGEFTLSVIKPGRPCQYNKSMKTPQRTITIISSSIIKIDSASV